LWKKYWDWDNPIFIEVRGGPGWLDASGSYLNYNDAYNAGEYMGEAYDYYGGEVVVPWTD
jgi:hypothetical protein